MLHKEGRGGELHRFGLKNYCIRVSMLTLPCYFCCVVCVCLCVRSVIYGMVIFWVDLCIACLGSIIYFLWVYLFYVLVLWFVSFTLLACLLSQLFPCLFLSVLSPTPFYHHPILSSSLSYCLLIPFLRNGLFALLSPLQFSHSSILLRPLLSSFLPYFFSFSRGARLAFLLALAVIKSLCR